MPKTTSVTVKFDTSERDELAARATAQGLPLRTYIRRSVLACGDVSRETALVLAEVRRFRALVTRLWSFSLRGAMDGADVAEIEASVDAIDERVLIGKVKGKG